MDNTIGPDISFWQDDNTTPQGINFAKMAIQTEWVIIRAGQNMWVDTDFKYNWSEAKKFGLARGSYRFYDSRVAPDKQAELWADTLGTDLGELPLFADFEDSYKGQYHGWRHWYVFLERLKSLLPRKEIFIYTGYFYWLENMAGVPAASINYFKQYPLWIASYNPFPQVPKPWTEWTFWQFTDNGNGIPYGVESKNIDLNYFNGDIIKFRERFGLDGQVPTEPPVEEHMEYSMKTNDYGMRIRDQHTTFGTVLSTIQAAGSIMFGTELWTAPADGNEVRAGDQWLYVTKVNGVALPDAQRGWMAYIHKGVTYCNTFTEVSGTIPVPVPTDDFEMTVKIQMVDNVMSMFVDGTEWKKV